MFKSALGAAAALTLAFFASIGSAREVIDHNGDVVQIPDVVKSAAATTIYPFPSAVAVFTRSPDIIAGMHESSMQAARNGLLGALFPSILKADTSFAKGDSVNAEALLALNPDVVFANAHDKRQIESLRSAGLAVYGVSATKWGYDAAKTHEAWLQTLSDVFPEHKEAALIAAKYRESIDSLVKSRVKDAVPKKIFFLVSGSGPQIVTSGRKFFGEYWAQSIGCTNAGHDLEAQKTQSVVTMEDVYAWNPDVVLITNFTSTTPEDVYNSTGTESDRDWTPVKAVKDKAVYKMPLGLYRSFTPSMDSPLTQLWLACVVHPELFSDVDFNEYARDFYQHVVGRAPSNEDLKKAFPLPKRASSAVEQIK